MRKPLIAVSLLLASAASFGQAKKTPGKSVPVKAKPAVATELRTAADSVSYAIGMSLASFYKEQGIKDINGSLVSKALNDCMGNKTTLLTEEQMNMSISNYLQQLKKEKSAAARQEGEAFLAANKTKPSVVTLPSGLQYMVIKEGTGPKPAATDKVKCHYHGTLINGQIFDSSVDRGQPIDFNVNGVIKGWVEALQLMPVGSKWKLFIPADLAYGDSQAGPYIMPGSTLIFDVELLEIVQ
ncbi:FKBP-type peptidyl-prolyl cis-trans isomerase [Flavihumibacter petaseus]|uniref:Peptidyl-prolyl cis-trans isomerase n=1 Tax=Flavihumibacter petaseus NBRC 106054 TaxID=1220578 RepID=A0A0E9N0T2_9BACT|nr:FKBP-type peptidyl-prolyl cis-trans isomerase [Flavihumibacter petaseus]GAO43622.1 FKBP-type peptidyl-prolyl cis-trans isomerase [Flavihumibacter petaseus NBRC 106054]